MNLIILFIFLFNLTNCLKSNNFCELDSEKHQHRCHGSFSFKCAANICAKNQADSIEYRQMIENLKIYSAKNETKKYLKEMVKYKVIKKSFKKCELKPPNITNDFCMVRKVSPKIGIGYKASKFSNVDCECLTEELSFRCGRYCTVDSTSCSYLSKNSKIAKFISNRCDCQKISNFSHLLASF